jgi:two-component system, LuxR family, response regulator FixJ
VGPSKEQDTMSIPQGPVILVDDDAAVRNALKFALELEGLDVRVYPGAAELLAADLPTSGCLLLDYLMPTIDGVELLDRLRSRKVDLPAILITSRPDEKVLGRAARSGFRAVLEKPLSDGKLLDSIRSALAVLAAPAVATPA